MCSTILKVLTSQEHLCDPIFSYNVMVSASLRDKQPIHIFLYPQNNTQNSDVNCQRYTSSMMADR